MGSNSINHNIRQFVQTVQTVSTASRCFHMQNESTIFDYWSHGSITLLGPFGDRFHTPTFAFCSLRFTAPTPTPRRLMFHLTTWINIDVDKYYGDLEDNQYTKKHSARFLLFLPWLHRGSGSVFCDWLGYPHHCDADRVRIGITLGSRQQPLQHENGASVRTRIESTTRQRYSGACPDVLCCSARVPDRPACLFL